MNFDKPSTEKQPLLFFQEFLTEDRLLAYEENFYDMPVNPSQEKNIEEGFIEYHKDCYKDGEPATVKIFFTEKLRSLLVIQANVTFTLLTDRKLQKEYDEVFANGFVQRQLTELVDLSEKAKSLPHQEIILKVLKDLKKNIATLLYSDKQEPSGKTERPSKITKPFFGNKQKTTPHRLKKLYDELLDIGLIDEEEVREEAFVNVFTSSDPEKEPDKIFFSGNNYQAVFFLTQLSPFFEKLVPAQIGKSKSFFTKGDKVMSENLINSYSSRLRKRDKNEYEEIQRAVLKAMPPRD